MPLKIVNVQGKAAKAGLQPDDIILKVNDEPINDFIDLQFHTADEELDFNVKKSDGTVKNIKFTRNWDQPLGIEPAQHNARTCANNCVFCFVDMMRPGLRQSLYIKDDDYVLSFTFGNFITLTNLSDKDFDRIEEQRLSPLYVSVHTTNPVLHKQMLGYKHNFNIKNALQRLADAGIEYNAQIVMVPGYNDAIELSKTLADLCQEDSGAMSIGIVPVGLTRYQNTLPGSKPLQSVTKQQAQQAIDLADRFNEGREENLVFCADEMYLKAEQPIPDTDYYVDFAQIENGIGMIRLLLDELELCLPDLAADLSSRSNKALLICGQSIAPVMQNLAKQLNNTAGKQFVSVLPITNNFFGPTVTVSGLLAACDIIEQVAGHDFDLLMLPESMFNTEGVTMDGLTTEQIKQKVGVPLFIGHEFMESWEFVE